MKRKLTLDEWKAIGKNLKEFRTQQLVGNFFQTLTKNYGKMTLIKWIKLSIKYCIC